MTTTETVWRIPLGGYGDWHIAHLSASKMSPDSIALSICGMMQISRPRYLIPAHEGTKRCKRCERKVKP